MIHYLLKFFYWSEVWAPVVPLVILGVKRNQPIFLKPVIIYLCSAVLLNIVIDLIGEFRRDYKWLPGSNNPLYNIHSILRFVCFTCFFLLLKQEFFKQLEKILPLIFGLFVLVNFTIAGEKFLNPDHISGNLFTAEAFVLLIFCLLYYLSKLKNNNDELTSGKDFWVVTGLSTFVVTNFFVFLFYVPMMKENRRLADNMWDVHNVAYIILCIFIAKAFYVSAKSLA